MKTVNAEILTIGDEILYGQITDTNSQWIGNELAGIGIRVIRKTSVGDDEQEILTALSEARSRAQVVIITGGLGPTSDDLTKPCLVKFFNTRLEIHQEALNEVTAFFASRGRELTELNRQQAALPVNCEKITNVAGTAPGMWFDVDNVVYISMPGVPHEMKTMMRERILPKLGKRFTLPVILHRIVRTAGIGESFLAEKIAGWEKALPPSIKLAYLPSLGMVKLRLTASGPDRSRLESECHEQVQKLLPQIDEFVYNGKVPVQHGCGRGHQRHCRSRRRHSGKAGGYSMDRLFR